MSRLTISPHALGKPTDDAVGHEVTKCHLTTVAGMKDRPAGPRNGAVAPLAFGRRHLNSGASF